MTAVLLGSRHASRVHAWRRLYLAGCRLGARLRDFAAIDDPETEKFLHMLHTTTPTTVTALRGSVVDVPSNGVDPIDRLVEAFGLSGLDIDLLLLGALGEIHEGLGAALASFHPEGAAMATPGLAVAMADAGMLGDGGVGDEASARFLVRDALTSGPLRAIGVVSVPDTGIGPFWNRGITIDPYLWDTLCGIERWPDGVALVEPFEVVGEPFARWLKRTEPSHAIEILQSGQKGLVVIESSTPSAGLTQGLLLAAAAGITPVGLRLEVDARLEKLAAHLVLRDALPVLWCPQSLPPGLDVVDGPIVVVRVPGTPSLVHDHPQFVLRDRPIGRAVRRDAWATLLPELGPTTRGPADLEPLDIAAVAGDVRFATNGGSRMRSDARNDVQRSAIESVSRSSLRVRFEQRLPPGLRLLTPSTTLDDLVVTDRTRQLLVDLVRQARQLVDIELLSGVADDLLDHLQRAERPGLRALLSGPPGVGKTVAAAAIAHATDRSLLVVDLSQMVSKWLGETEKHLDAAFAAAEQGDAVLFFDEADSLFAARTESADAHDRYANLETGYLLGRLERFTGVAVLATNDRHAIDRAFLRRFEFLIGFELPDAFARAALWRCSVPAWSSLSSDVDVVALAETYELAGGHIRNAVTAAAHLAGPGQPIGPSEVIVAVQRELGKNGLHFAGPPYGWPKDSMIPAETHHGDRAAMMTPSSRRNSS